VSTGAKEKGITAGDGRWVRGWLGGAVRRSISGIHKSRAVFGSGIVSFHFHALWILSDLLRSGALFRSTLLPVRARRGVLCAAEGVGEILL